MITCDIGYTLEEQERMAKMQNTWVVSPNSEIEDIHYNAQRCPRTTIDTFLFYKDSSPGSETVLILGEINKPPYNGLVVAGGGHIESLGDRGNRYELGCPNIDAAAQKEIFEEVGITMEQVKQIQPIGFIDYPFNDPRFHVIRFIQLAWVTSPGIPSDELKTLARIPVRQLDDFCKRKICYTKSDGTELNLVLNHDLMIELIMALPETKQFLNIISPPQPQGYYDRD